MQLMQSAITNNQQATPASEHSETARSGKSGFNNASNFSGKWATFPQVGDTIAEDQISNAFGSRKSPCPGCSSMHFGNDVATSRYTPLYALDLRRHTIQQFPGLWSTVARVCQPFW
jgi:murein DD-endopeptidase MepM/ murein hydrolase activator NlpD